MGFGQMDAAKPPVQRGHLCFHPFCRKMETKLTVRRSVTPNPPVSTSELIIQGVARPLLDQLYAQYLHRAGSSRRVSQACTSRLSYRLRVGFRRTAWSVNCFPTVEEFTRRALPKPRRVATVEPIAD